MKKSIKKTQFKINNNNKEMKKSIKKTKFKVNNINK
jgi:hypothetical protein